MAIKDIRELPIDLELALSRGIANCAAYVTEELTDATPQDTGHAASNWVPNGEGIYGSKQSVDFASQAAAIRALIAYRLRSGPIDITNSVPYIGKLNEGYSPKAPSGFILQAVERGVARANSDNLD